MKTGSKSPRYFLTDDDIRYEFRIMQRWCRWFRKTAEDWVSLEAARFRERHPVISAALPDEKAA
jgi:hypothetical protein